MSLIAMLLAGPKLERESMVMPHLAFGLSLNIFFIFFRG